MMCYIVTKKHAQESVRGTNKYIHKVDVIGSYDTREEAEAVLQDKFLRFIDLFSETRLRKKTKDGKQNGLIRVVWDTHTIEYRYNGKHAIDEYSIKEVPTLW